MSDSEEEEEEEEGGGEEAARQAAIRAAVQDGALVETDAPRSAGTSPDPGFLSVCNILLMATRGFTWHMWGCVSCSWSLVGSCALSMVASGIECDARGHTCDHVHMLRYVPSHVAFCVIALLSMLGLLLLPVGFPG